MVFIQWRERMLKQCLLTGTLLAAVTLLANPVLSAEKEFHQTYSLREGESVSVKNVNGSVTVKTGSGSGVDVFAVIKSNKGQSVIDRCSIEVSTDGGLRIETKYDSECGEDDTFFKRLFGGNISKSKANVEYTITVPEYALIGRVSTTNGSVTSEGTHGDATFSSTNGNITIDHLDGRVEAHTTNGNLNLSGEATVVRGRTTNGSIKATLPETLEENIDLSTTNGSVSVTMSTATDAVVDLATTNGGIDASGFTMTLENSSKRHLRGRIGDGGPHVSIRTTNGGVRLIGK